MKIRYLWLIMLLASCDKANVLKEVNWKGNLISWEVLDGGATTSYRWLIRYSKKGENNKNLIFESYSTPYIGNIKVHQDELLILIPDFRHKVNDTIALNLKDIEGYIDKPVVYERDILTNSNRYYREPKFVKDDRRIH